MRMLKDQVALVGGRRPRARMRFERVRARLQSNRSILWLAFLVGSDCECEKSPERWLTSPHRVLALWPARTPTGKAAATRLAAYPLSWRAGTALLSGLVCAHRIWRRRQVICAFASLPHPVSNSSLCGAERWLALDDAT